MGALYLGAYLRNRALAGFMYKSKEKRGWGDNLHFVQKPQINIWTPWNMSWNLQNQYWNLLRLLKLLCKSQWHITEFLLIPIMWLSYHSAAGPRTILLGIVTSIQIYLLPLAYLKGASIRKHVQLMPNRDTWHWYNGEELWLSTPRWVQCFTNYQTAYRDPEK